ncbi:MAG: nuclease-related domain-containing protein, partial [Kiritimatiellia bacterium]|nr:nuclease-related domain-containing protein [Kiritimatiellia bacterium]
PLLFHGFARARERMLVAIMARILKVESSLRTREEKLRRETAWLLRLRRVEWIAAFLLLGFGAFRWFAKGNERTLIWGFLASLLALGHEWKRRENEREAKQLAIGSGGERDLSKRLERELPDDTLILNDLEIRHGRHHAQIDHLVISPRGLFVVETKTWAGRLSGRAEDEHWMLRAAGREPRAMKNPVRQNRRQAQVLREKLAFGGLGGIEVIPLVALASSRCVLEPTEDLQKALFPADRAVAFIRDYPARRPISGEQQREILALLKIGWPSNDGF